MEVAENVELTEEEPLHNNEVEENEVLEGEGKVGDKINVDDEGSTASVVVYLAVDEPIWKYMTRNQKYSSLLKKIEAESEVTILDYDFDSRRLPLRGLVDIKVKYASREIGKLIEECRQEVFTYILPCLEEGVHLKVVSFLEESEKEVGCMFTTGPGYKVFLTGKKEKIDNCLGLLGETFGVSGALPFISDTAEKEHGKDNNAAGDDSLQNSVDEILSGNHDVLKLSDDGFTQDDLDEELYGAEKDKFVELEVDALIIDEKIWCYMEKHLDYSDDIKKIKEKSDLSVLREDDSGRETNGSRVRLVFTGSDEADVHAAVYKAKSVIDRCQEADARTLQVPCPEAAVHQKITKLLKSINRLPSYVSVAPEVIAITGTKLEIENCVEKLRTYGLVYEFPSAPPVQVSLPSDDDEGNGRRPGNDEMPADSFTEDRYPETEQYGHCRQLPTPIEELLWLYIDHSHKQQLDELRKDYDLHIIADGTGSGDFMNITVASNSAEMLECGQDALISLIEHLRSKIVVGVMDVAPAEPPPEFQRLLRQQCQDVEALIVMKGSKICIVGPDQEASKCRELVMAFMRNIAADARSRGYDTSKFDQTLEPFDSLPNGHNSPTSLSGANTGDLDKGDNEGNFYPESPKQDEYHRGHIPSEKTFPEKNRSEAQLDNEGKRMPERQSCDRVRTSDHEISAHDTEHLGKVGNGRRQPPESSSSDRVTGHGSSTSPGDKDYEKLEPVHGYAKEKTSGSCSICSSDSATCADKSPQDSCDHYYCLSCIRRYFGEHECPVCGSGERSHTPIITQPDGGIMLTTYDNSFKLPGFEDSSRGTITVTYAFPSGIQSADLPAPGRLYSSLTTSAFFPMCLEGSKVVDLLQKAFDKRLLFKISQSKDDSHGRLVWNGILHKVNIFGGPQGGGYPDPIYLKRIYNDLAAKGITEAD